MIAKYIFAATGLLCLLHAPPASAFGPQVSFVASSAGAVLRGAKAISKRVGGKPSVVGKISPNTFIHLNKEFLAGIGPLDPKCIAQMNVNNGASGAEQHASVDELNMYCD